MNKVVKRILIIVIVISILIAVYSLIHITYFSNSNKYFQVSSEVSKSDIIDNENITEQEPLVVLVEDTNQNIDINDDKPSVEEKATEQELKENKVEQKDLKSNTNPYYIKINCQANTITVYTKDTQGNYSVPYKAMICSTGYATPQSGVYKTRKINTWHALFGNVYGQYCTQIVGNILFHSVPYTERGNNSSLEYWEYDKLGTTASAGCIRLKVCDAEWIYNNCNNGTLVEFYRSSTPGPLGKPSASKISKEVSPYKNWDPTDSNPNNPWITKPASTTNNSQNNNTIENNNSQNNNTQNNNVNTNSTFSNSTTNSNSLFSNSLQNNTINAIDNTNSLNTQNITNTIYSNEIQQDQLNNTNTSSTINNSLKNTASSK